VKEGRGKPLAAVKGKCNDAINGRYTRTERSSRATHHRNEELELKYIEYNLKSVTVTEPIVLVRAGVLGSAATSGHGWWTSRKERAYAGPSCLETQQLRGIAVGHLEKIGWVVQAEASGNLKSELRGQ
jgi:hypothetical protein